MTKINLTDDEYDDIFNTAFKKIEETEREGKLDEWATWCYMVESIVEQYDEQN